MVESRVPWWLFAIVAIGALLASGVHLGIMSSQGITGMRTLQAAGFGVLGLVMFWGAIHRE
ncbi:MAG: hypothetical protein PVG11_09965 [Anaerolineae bacterium]|jgi:hypothetical protein